MSLRVFFAFALAFWVAGCKKASTSAAGGNGGIDPSVSSPTMAALEAHDARMTAIIMQISDALNGVTDEASARAASPRIRALTPTYAAAGKTRLQLIAVLDNTHKPELGAYLKNQMEDREKNPLPLEFAIEKTAKGPFAALLRGDIDAVLDANLEQLPVRQKQRAEDEYRRRGWRK
jgi:hypothetical protein